MNLALGLFKGLKQVVGLCFKLASLDTPLIALLIPKKWNFVKFEFSYAVLSKIFYEETDSGMDLG